MKMSQNSRYVTTIKGEGGVDWKLGREWKGEERKG